MAVLDNLEPKSIWQHFEKICEIPHPSGHEAALLAHIKGWAEEFGFDTKRDKVGNLFVYVPASKGQEGAPTVVLQGHVDMVPEKNSDVQHDFEKDPIRPRIEDDWVYATGTTLGADNGIGVAAAMAVAESKDLVHGPLELVFTIDEETGLTGAAELDTSLINGRILLNLDSEEDGIFYVGCAGGGDTELKLATGAQPVPSNAAFLQLKVSGLRGGHSGCDIHENRGNAIKVLARVLDALEDIPWRLAQIEGGGKHNAIPREAGAIIALPEAEQEKVLDAVEKLMGGLLEEFGPVEPSLEVTAAKVEAPAGAKVLDAASRDKVLNLLLTLPHGVIAMSRDIPGLVETSTNLATVKLEDGTAEVLTSSRSSVASALEGVREQIAAATRLAGGSFENGEAYPGWNPDLDSKLLATAKQVYQTSRGETPEVSAIHAGLECGIIGDRIGGMDMLSFGPDIQNPHSPDERVGVSSVGRFWTFLGELLKALTA